VPAPQHGDEGGRAGGRLARFTIPGPPVSKLRARSFIDSRTGGIGHFTPKKTVDFEHLVRTIARINYRGAPVQGQIALVVIQLYHTPASWSKSRRDRALSGSSLHTVKPDEDNVTKAVKDGLSKIVYCDDAQVSLTVSLKRYSRVERTIVLVYDATEALMVFDAIAAVVRPFLTGPADG
jgi:Holliday junction resolvase RusA-like endonuclease